MHSITQTQKILPFIPRQVNASNKNTPSMHHPQRQNVTTPKVGLKKTSHIHKNLTQNVEPHRCRWERRRRRIVTCTVVCWLLTCTVWFRSEVCVKTCLMYILLKTFTLHDGFGSVSQIMFFTYFMGKYAMSVCELSTNWLTWRLVSVWKGLGCLEVLDVSHNHSNPFFSLSAVNVRRCLMYMSLL